MDPSPTGGGDGSWLAGSFMLLSLASSFLFSGIETALTTLGEARIRKLVEARQGPRHWLELWLRDPSRASATLLAGNTISNLVAAAMTTWLAIGLAQRLALAASGLEWAVAGLVAVLAFVLLLASEVAPRALAQSHPHWFVPAMFGVWPFHLLARGLTATMTWTAAQVAHASGGKPILAAPQVTEEQIEDMVRIGSEAGSIDENQGDMLQNVFDLSDLSVRSIMTPRTQIYGLRLEATFDEVANEVQASNFSRYPVYERTLDRIVGIFYAKDLILHALCRASGPFKLEDHMREAFFVPETKKALQLMKDFQTQSVHMAIVVDEHGGTSGIVTLEDVLEELVGEIYDEYDQPDEPVVRQVAPNGWTVDASAEIRDIADDLHLDLPENGSYSTVGGFIVDRLGRVPKQGEELMWNDLRFHVLEADETRVVRVEVHREPAPQERDGLRAVI